MLGAYKLCTIPININYRYVEEELKYLIDNADMEAVFYHKQFGTKLNFYTFFFETFLKHP